VPPFLFKDEPAMTAPIDMNALVHAVGDAIVVSDVAGEIVVWNAAAERMFGYTEAEALGQTLDLITPEKFRKRHWDGYHQTMATGITKYGTTLLRVPAINKAGQSLSIAFGVAMLFGADGKPTAIASIIRDETARFAEDRAQRKRIVELETELGILATARPSTTQ
jgi:PAS domain S-box-containing protein